MKSLYAFLFSLCLVLTGAHFAGATHDVTGREYVTAGTQALQDPNRAAVTRNWGPVKASDEFLYTGKPDSTKWGVYNGPGHAGKGKRSPTAMSVAGGVLTVTGNSQGVTGGMASKFGVQKYGRWEARMRIGNNDSQYHPVLILWPTIGWTNGTCWELDYAEGTGSLTKVNFFQHHKCGGQTSASKAIDMRQWHNYAINWNSSGVTGYIDGQVWFANGNDSHSPNVRMFQTIQLDWFPKSGVTPKTSTMQVDWVRFYG